MRMRGGARSRLDEAAASRAETSGIAVADRCLDRAGGKMDALKLELSTIVGEIKLTIDEVMQRGYVATWLCSWPVGVRRDMLSGITVRSIARMRWLAESDNCGIERLVDDHTVRRRRLQQRGMNASLAAFGEAKRQARRRKTVRRIKK